MKQFLKKYGLWVAAGAVVLVIVIVLIVNANKKEPEESKPDFYIDSKGRKVPNDIRSVVTEQKYLNDYALKYAKMWLEENPKAEEWITKQMQTKNQTREEAIDAIVKNHYTQEFINNDSYNNLTDQELIEIAFKEKWI